MPRFWPALMSGLPVSGSRVGDGPAVWLAIVLLATTRVPGTNPGGGAGPGPGGPVSTAPLKKMPPPPRKSPPVVVVLLSIVLLVISSDPPLKKYTPPPDVFAV